MFRLNRNKLPSLDSIVNDIIDNDIAYLQQQNSELKISLMEKERQIKINFDQLHLYQQAYQKERQRNIDLLTKYEILHRKLEKRDRTVEDEDFFPNGKGKGDGNGKGKAKKKRRLTES